MPAKKFGSQIDLQRIPVLGLVPESNVTGSRPASPVAGQLFYNQTLTRLEIYESGGWVLASSAGSELLSNKGIASGYAGLDGSVRVPLAQLPVATSGSSSATEVVRADDTRLSNSRAPSGPATGSLGGNYPNPSIAAGAIGSAEVAAAIKDAAAGTASLRTLGTSATSAMAGNTTLNAIATATATVSMGNQLVSNVATPVSATDAANKGYVDGISQSLDIKASVHLASTANVAVTYAATSGTSARGQITVAPNTLDGVSLAQGDRILLKDQTTGAQNGIWVVTTLGTGANGVWDRAPDFDSDAEVTPGAFTFVEEGTVNGDSGWVLATNAPIVIGGASGTTLVWTQFSGAGSVIAGNGLTKTGTTIDVVGTANRITVAADSIDIASNYVGQATITTLGTIATGTWQGTAVGLAYGGTGATTAPAARTALGAVGKYAADLGAMTAGVEVVITHSLGTLDVQATFRTTADGYDVLMSWRAISTTQVGVTADVAYAASAIRTVVVG